MSPGSEFDTSISETAPQSSVTHLLPKLREARELIAIANVVSADIDEGIGRFQIYGDELRLAKALQRSHQLSNVVESIRHALLELRKHSANCKHELAKPARSA